VDRFGRRALMLIGCGALVVTHTLIGLAYFYDKKGPAAVVPVMASMAVYAMSLAPITWVLISEIFPNRIRGAAVSVAVSALWIACFISLGNIALLTNWMATFFQELGEIPIEVFAVSAMISFIGGATGTLIMGYLMDRVNPYWLIVAFFLVEAVALFLLGQVPFASWIFLAALIAWNFTQVGGQTGINNLATLSYPPEMGSSGIGWAGGWGRIAGIVIAPFAGAAALRMVLPLETIMTWIAGMAVAVAVLIALLGVMAPSDQFTRHRKPAQVGYH